MPNPARTALTAIALSVVAACDPTQPLFGPREVDVTPARRATVAEILDYPGHLKAPTRVEVVARTRGYLLERTFEDGSTIEQDQVLFVLEADPYESAVEEARGEVQAARAALELAESGLRPGGDLPDTKKTEDAARLDAARGSVRAAQARLNQAEITASYTTLRAPIDGTISDRPVDVGNLVQPGDRLATIVQLDPMYLEFEVGGSDLTRLQTAQRETPILTQAVTAAGVVHPQPGRVEILGGAADPESGKVRVRATIPNPQTGLISEQEATARLLLRWHVDAILVPAAAVGDGPDGPFVRIVGADRRVEHRPVTVGPLQSGEHIVRQGVEESELVVVGRARAAIPGRTVVAKSRPSSPRPTPASAPRVTPPATPRVTPPATPRVTPPATPRATPPAAREQP